MVCKYKMQCLILKYLILKYGLTQMVCTPTRVTKHSSSIINHIYSNSLGNIVEVNVPNYSVIDHFPISFYNKRKSVNFLSLAIRYRCFTNLDESVIQYDVLYARIDRVDTCCDPNPSLHLIYNIINIIISLKKKGKT